MTKAKLAQLFHKYTEQYSLLDQVTNPIRYRTDLIAFLILDRLDPQPGLDMVGGANHDEIWLEIDPGKAAKNATEEDVRTLVQCGVRYSSDDEMFRMFV